ncbi:MAG: DUF86 domain-containing protein [Variovorax sp.]
MSEVPLAREWRFYVEDMVAFCDKVLNFTQGFDRASFATDVMRYDATLRNLELIGEAATHVPGEARALAPEVPWRMVIALRNRLIHGYLGIDDDTLWSIVQDDIALLRDGLTKLLATR